MADYLVSDLHLDDSCIERFTAFKAFVERSADMDRLFILGDFFNAWIGDDDDNPFFLSVVAQLKEWSNKGLNISFTHGNRDFLVGEQLARNAGMRLLNEEHIETLGEKQVLLMHGDSLCIDDSEYQTFRAQVRSPEWQQQILAMPLEQRRQLAAQLRTQSQSMNAMKAEDITDVNYAEVLKVMSAHKVTTLIHGHTHRPDIHSFSVDGSSAQRLVLGDWQSQGWYVRADNKALMLESFPI